jgi:DNA-binding winged helix-turn-helix (wHTH) protein
MPDATQSASIRRFGPFEINLQSEDLRKNGMRVRLSGQPFQLLAVLVERLGELVIREELRSSLWPVDTFVDFDHGLNNAVARIREVLDDSSDTPRYVETIPRRGYRFIAPLADLRPAAHPGASGPSAPTTEQRFPSARLRVLLGGTAVLALIGIPFVLYRGSGATGSKQPVIKSLAVLPLKTCRATPRRNT